MRVIYDPAGNDISTTMQTSLQNNRSVFMANLYTFMHRQFWKNDTAGNIVIWSFTDADIPLALQQLQLFASGASNPLTLNNSHVVYNQSSGSSYITYSPEKITRGKLSYEVGLVAKDVEVTWYIDDTQDYFAALSGSYGTLQTPATSALSMKQAMATYRAFDDCPFWIHRGVFFATQPIWDGSLLGCFTDGTGQIVAGQTPFLIANGGTFIVPAGANQLQMGMNDYPYSDNSGAWVMSVNASNVTVNSTCAPYVYTAGVLNTAFPIPSSGQAAPVVVSGLTAGQNVLIQYVSGTCGLHFSSPPFFGPIGAVNFAFSGSSSSPGQYAVSTIPTSTPVLEGTSLMYRGFIRKTSAAADSLSITLGSLMQILQDTQFPTQLIMPGNRDVQFIPSPGVSSAYLTTPLTVTSPVSVTFKAGSTLTQNQLQDCWVTFQPSLPANVWAPQSGLPPVSTPGWRIMSNTAAASGANTNVTFYDPLIIPASPAAVNVFTQTSGSAPGFNAVPPPENSL